MILNLIMLLLLSDHLEQKNVRIIVFFFSINSISTSSFLSDTIPLPRLYHSKLSSQNYEFYQISFNIHIFL